MFVMLLIFTVIGEKSHLKMILPHTNDSIWGGGGGPKRSKTSARFVKVNFGF
jgi:hypothetical protein